jgi:hypothetical protein
VKPGAGAELAQALEAVLESLAAGDAVAACATLDRVGKQLGSTGPLDKAQLAQARELTGRCEQAAQALRQTLTQAVCSAGTSRRAADAYGAQTRTEVYGSNE